MGIYHQNALTGAELQKCIGTPEKAAGFDNNPHATGAGVADFYQQFASAPDAVAPTNNGPSEPTPM